jgi:diguanylate cyclase (GGDEF)-like protein
MLDGAKVPSCDRTSFSQHEGNRGLIERRAIVEPGPVQADRSVSGPTTIAVAFVAAVIFLVGLWIVEHTVTSVGVLAGLAFAAPALMAYLISPRQRVGQKIGGKIGGHDALTSLPDREHFCEGIDRALKHGEFGAKSGVFMLEVDGHSAIVNQHGEAVGDELLKQFALRLKTNVRHGDVIAYLGADRFGIVQRLIRSSQDCDAMINRLRAILLEPYDIRGTEVRIGLNVGLVLLQGDVLGPGAVMNAAEAILLQSQKALPASTAVSCAVDAA